MSEPLDPVRDLDNGIALICSALERIDSGAGQQLTILLPADAYDAVVKAVSRHPEFVTDEENRDGAGWFGFRGALFKPSRARG